MNLRSIVFLGASGAVGTEALGVVKSHPQVADILLLGRRSIYS